MSPWEASCVPSGYGSRSGDLGNMGDLFRLPPFPRLIVLRTGFRARRWLKSDFF
jgi:hypothetical protein